MLTTWFFHIDWERVAPSPGQPENYLYDGLYDDVTERVLSAEWFLGMRQPYQDVADNSVLTLVLDNFDRRFSPENSNSPLAGKILPGRPVRIRTQVGGIDKNQWFGWIESVQPTTNPYGKRTVTIVAMGPMMFFKATETKIALQENKKTGAIIEALIDEVLDASSEFRINYDAGNVADGYLTLPIAGDNWVRQGGYTDAPQTNFDIYRAIAEVSASERGRFFFDRSGYPCFYDRTKFTTIDLPTGQAAPNNWYYAMGQAPAPTTPVFDDTMLDMAYAFASLDQLHNDIAVLVHSRTVSAGTSDVLWEGAGIDLPYNAGVPANGRKIYIHYQDPVSGKRVSGKSPSTSAMQTNPPGVLNVSILINGKATGAELIVSHNDTGPVGDVNAAFKILGKRISDSGWVETRAEDATSISYYGRRTLRLNLPSISKEADARTIANFELERRKKPFGLVQSVTLASHASGTGAHHANQRNFTLFNAINLRESQTGHQETYFIIGEAHSLQPGGLWKTTWYLEPVPRVTWKLENSAQHRGELSYNTRLG